MFKKLLTYFLLLNFLNTVFFCNNEPEDYNVFRNGEQDVEAEINSVVEYVVEECLDIKDTTPEDEDDDFDDPFKTEKTDWCSYSTIIFEYLPCNFIDLSEYTSYYNTTFHQVFLEIHSPPPRQA